MRHLLLSLLLTSLAVPAFSQSYVFKAQAKTLRVAASPGVSPIAPSPNTPAAPTAPAACELPWGGTLASEAPALTAYSQSTVAFGSSCTTVVTQVTCTKGILDLKGATSPTCSVQEDADPYWQYVSLLIQGENGITDSSSQRKSLSLVGQAQVSTAQAKYGTGSIAVDGTGDYVDAGSSPRFAMGTADFTIETWAKSNVAGKQNAYFLMLDSTGGLSFGIENGWLLLGRRATSTDVNVSYSVDTSWHHYAVTRSNGVVRIFVDGVQRTMGSNSVNYSVTGPARIGGFNLAGYEWNGHLDDFRITQGVARYVGNFQPPTRQLAAR